MCWVSILKGPWDLVSKVITTLIGVISIVTLLITLVTKSHDPLSTGEPRKAIRGMEGVGRRLFHTKIG